MTEPKALALTHRVRLPASAQPHAENERHPAIIALHGRGSNEDDLLGLAPYLDSRLLWISPRAPLSLEGGFEWYRLRDIGKADQATFEAALKLLTQFVTQAVEAYPVDPARTRLLGFSQGGMMGLSLMLAQPALMAGLIAHSSYLPLEALQAAATVDEAGVRDKPCLMLHGSHDPVIPVQWARQARDTLTGLGATVTYQEFPMGHNVSEESLAAVQEWLAQPPTPEE